VALSAFGIILSSPLWLLFGSLIWLEDRGPVFYTQEREGKGGRVFKAYKFRSMIKDAEQDGTPVQAEKDDHRVTSVGRLLRVTAMDELPQLFNIFRGDMSFVGPRALRPAEVERGRTGWLRFQKEIEETEAMGEKSGKKPNSQKIVALKEIPGYRERLKVKPGLTGLAQVYLPADAPRKDKFRYDVFYIKGQSFWFDLKLIFRSFWISFRGKWEEEEK